MIYGHFFPLFFLLDDAFLLLFGPLLYLYTLSQIYRRFVLTKKYGYHFIPFGMCFLFLLLLYSSTGISHENSLAAVNKANVPDFVLVILILFYLHGGIYLWLSKQKLKVYDRIIKERYSNPGKVNLDWLHFIINSFIGIWLLGILQSVVPFTVYKPYIDITLFIFIVFLFYFINKVIFKALRRPGLFSGISNTDIEKYGGV